MGRFLGSILVSQQKSEIHFQNVQEIQNTITELVADINEIVGKVGTCTYDDGEVFIISNEGKLRLCRIDVPKYGFPFVIKCSQDYWVNDMKEFVGGLQRMLTDDCVVYTINNLINPK
jgi:hypothetical protein